MHNHSLSLSRIALLAVTAAHIALSGCGGGGSSSTPTATCNAASIRSYIAVDGTRTETASVMVNSGTQVTLSPESASGGSWAWTGCGTSGSSREQIFTPTASCAATVTYTNS